MVAVTERAHANRNPRATFYDQPLTIEDHQASRLVVDPFHLFDCCLETDGGGALVLTSADRARDRPGPVAMIRAAAQAGPGLGGNVERLGSRIFRAAGLSPSDVDVVQIYDHFSPFVIFALEGYGFVASGEGGEFVEAGGMAWDGGALPVNTSGGHLSEAYLQGMNHLIEGVRQARGESTAQVEDAQFSFVDTGVGTGAVVFERSA
jgi:acetyl-CoA acetyltransferase